MKTGLVFLVLCLSLLADQTVTPGVSQAVATGSTTTPTNADPAYNVYWDMESLALNWTNRFPRMSAQEFHLFPLPQTNTQTAVGTVTGSGNMTVTITAAAVAGSPLAISVPVLAGDTPVVWAQKVISKLLTVPAVTSVYTVSGDTLSNRNIIYLSAKANVANDATLNIAVANDTSTGITNDSTSNNVSPAASSPSISTGWAHSGTHSLYIPAITTFPEAIFPRGYYDLTYAGNSRYWASPQKGSLELWFNYPGSWVSGALLMLFTGKAPNTVYDNEDGIQIETFGATGGGFRLRWQTFAGAQSLNRSAQPTQAANTPVHLVARWNSVDPLRTMVLYVDNEAPAVFKTALTAAQGGSLHYLLPGNDVATAMEYYIDDLYIYPNFAYDLPVTAWQNFEFATVDQASLEANDHNSVLTWELVGTTTRFTTNASGQMTSPCTINLLTDSGTLGLRNDLSSTTACNIGLKFANTSSGLSYGFDFFSANLANDTTSQINYPSQDTGVNLSLAIKQVDTGGQETISVYGGDTFLAGSVNISANTRYWISVRAIRNATSTINVYDYSGGVLGALVGAVTCTARNNDIGSIRFGDKSATTAQSAGTYWYVDNLVYDSNNIFPLKPKVGND